MNKLDNLIETLKKTDTSEAGGIIKELETLKIFIKRTHFVEGQFKGEKLMLLLTEKDEDGDFNKIKEWLEND